MNFKSISIPFAESLLLSILIIPIVRWISIAIGLVDKPNERKVHSNTVPLAGGISIALATGLILSFGVNLNLLNPQDLTWLGGSLIMLITGVLDDRFNIKPVYRLLTQFACAGAVAYAGIRIPSLYGIGGVYELPVVAQYVVTIVVIAGVVNAYNLMDGIDGLLGSLTLIGSATLGIISWSLNHNDLAIFFAVLSGAIIGFLRYNLGSKKIFMGDAGSLMLGFILVTTAIRLLSLSSQYNHTIQLQLLLVVVGLFLVPVFDSLRVYRGRIKKGLSPFRADKTHLHHLLLLLEISHKRATLLIAILKIFILIVIVALSGLIQWWWILLVAIILFGVSSSILNLNKRVNEWKQRVMQMEKPNLSQS
jgi:UDP-GlcNAc:undecaprenyl-phosphate/decaprenyl-phosphate GlcNAc-1-phosphate transferase